MISVGLSRCIAEKLTGKKYKGFYITEKRKMKKWKITAWLIVVCMVCAAGGYLFLRMHNGIKIKPAGEHVIPKEVISYRQDNAEWAPDHLGDSPYTMKSSGCLVTCIASAISNSGDKVTPGELNHVFAENGIYDTDGNIQWSYIADMEGYSVEVYDGVSEADIAQCLSDGHYPIVRVRMHGIGNYHFVLIVGAEDGDYVCMDPLEDDLTKLSDYFGYVYAVRCVWKED